MAQSPDEVQYESCKREGRKTNRKGSKTVRSATNRISPALARQKARIVAKAIFGRYKQSSVKEALFDEKEWLEKIRGILLKEQDERAGKLSGYNIKIMIEYSIERSIQNLS